MSIVNKESLPLKPYARLMTLLGDQLITDKCVAVIELIKNCYDADATNVCVRFGNLSNYKFNSLPKEQLSFIEIEDDGCGMSFDTIKEVWLRPATPNKFDKKKRNQLHTAKGRIIQGEKGIGRFAIHKLGEYIELFTKEEGKKEVKLEMNFSDYDPNEANLFNQNVSYKLLEDVKNTIYEYDEPQRIVKNSGTIIRISNLRESWNDKDFCYIISECSKINGSNR